MKKYFNHVISMTVLSFFLIMAWACEENTYPSPDPWTEECSFFTPFTVEYEVIFSVFEEGPVRYPVPNATVTCMVKGLKRLPHPFLQDTCVWSEFIETTLTGITDTNGDLVKNFNFTYGSVGDYFTLEISAEKAGYYRGLISDDNRYFYHNSEWVKSNNNIGSGKRYESAFIAIKAINENP